MWKWQGLVACTKQKLEEEEEKGNKVEKILWKTYFEAELKAVRDVELKENLWREEQDAAPGCELLVGFLCLSIISFPDISFPDIISFPEYYFSSL